MLLSGERRRIKSANEYRMNSSPSSSSEDSSDSEDELRIESILKQSRTHLENIAAIKNRREFLRSEDYVSYYRFLINYSYLKLIFLRMKFIQLLAKIFIVWNQFFMGPLVLFVLFGVVMMTFEVSSYSYIQHINYKQML